MLIMIDDILSDLGLLENISGYTADCAASDDQGRVFDDWNIFKGDRTLVLPSRSQSGARRIACYESAMEDAHPFWNLSGLTNAALLGGLSRLVCSGRQLLAEVVAHLAEVEERRLHLDLGYGSMFAYCMSRLGLSEDEACRRIEVARIARRHSVVYPLLVSGQLSLSVVALLKPYLKDAHSQELFELVSGKSISQARELLASRFPRPDVPSKIRKLPDSKLAPRGTDRDKGTVLQQLPFAAVGQVRAMPLPVASARGAAPSSSPGSVNHQAPSNAASRGTSWRNEPPSDTPPSDAPSSETSPSETPANDPASSAPAPTVPSPAQNVQDVPPVRSAKAPRVIEPLSAARYRIQLTADSALKDKLELARDLMRHTVPSGDFAAILNRALDLLIDQLMRRRFGARGKRPAVPRSDHDGPKGAPSNASVVATQASAPHSSSTAQNSKAPRVMKGGVPSISRSTRRTVCERDGLRCTWRGPDGVRCESRAWLENDHADPRGRGGGSGPENIRLLCRAHNQRAAELQYGRNHMADAITRARKRRTRVSSSTSV
jgi:hypothetical protein